MVLLVAIFALVPVVRAARETVLFEADRGGHAQEGEMRESFEHLFHVNNSALLEHEMGLGGLPEDVTMPKQFGTGPNLILALGDSLTAGWINTALGRPFYPYGHAVSVSLGGAVQVLVDGISGGKVQDFVNKAALPSIVSDIGAAQATGPGVQYLLNTLPSKPTLALIMAGTNDLGSGTEAMTIFRYIQTWHEMVHKANVKTYALGIPATTAEKSPGSRKNDRLQINGALQSWCYRVPLCIRYVQTEDHLRSCDDGVHFTQDQYQSLGGCLASWISKDLGFPMQQQLPALQPQMGLPMQPAWQPQRVPQMVQPQLVQQPMVFVQPHAPLRVIRGL